MKLQLGDAQGALALYRAVLDLAHETNDGEREMRAHGNLSFVYRLLGELGPAVSHQQLAVEQIAAEAQRSCRLSRIVLVTAMNGRRRSGVDNRSQPYGLGDQFTACCLRIGRGCVKQSVTEMV